MRIRSGTLTGSWGNRSTSKRLPSSSMTSRRGGGLAVGRPLPSIVAGSSDDRSMPSSTSTVETSPAVNAGSSMARRWKGMVVGTPSIWNSSRARSIRRRAWSRSSPQTISLASSES